MAANLGAAGGGMGGGMGAPRTNFHPTSMDPGVEPTNQDLSDENNASPRVPRQGNHIQPPPVPPPNTYFHRVTDIRNSNDSVDGLPLD